MSERSGDNGLSLIDWAALVDAQPTDSRCQDSFASALRRSNSVVNLEQIAAAFHATIEVGVPVYLRVLELQPRNDHAMASLANLYAMFLDEKRARLWADRALAINPENADAVYAKLQTYHFPDDAHMKEELADRLLALRPSELQAVKDKSIALYLRGEKPPAMQLIEKYIRGAGGESRRIAERFLAQLQSEAEARELWHG